MLCPSRLMPALINESGTAEQAMIEGILGPDGRGGDNKPVK